MTKMTSEQIKEAVKHVMKAQNKSYGELAEYLEVSLPTVKRFMSKEELSLSRLLQICAWLEVGIGDLEKLILSGDESERVQFTEAQERFLAQNPSYLSFLFQLYADETPDGIQKKYGISKKSCDLYLLRLERLDLLTLKAGKVRLPHKTFPKPIPYGVLVKHQYDQVLDTGVNLFKRYNKTKIARKNPEYDKGSHGVLGVHEVSRDQYLAWHEKFKALYNEFTLMSAVTQYQKNVKDRKTVVLMHLHGVFDNQDPEVEGVKNMFGNVTELK
jgi:DNA-binding Xre family transcriptional regulator